MKQLVFLFAAALATVSTPWVPHAVGPAPEGQRRISGSFDVMNEPVEDGAFSDGNRIARFLLGKRFHGALDATAEGEMLTATTPVEGSAAYVAIEHVDGTLEGRHGTFMLQHIGTMTSSGQSLSITVVPDSGTGELVGLSGTLDVRINEKGHFYDFDYTLPAENEEDSPAVRARRFRDLVSRGRFDEARAMMAPDPRRWFAPKEGEGRPWRIGPGTGPWSAWDEHFRSTGEVVEWREGEDWASAVVRETNDYFRLLERGYVTNEITYYFDGQGSISGLLIGTLGERPPGRTEEFLAWARQHEPEELGELMPDGEIDPSGDHPERFRALLNRWRRAAGLEPIERGGSSIWRAGKGVLSEIVDSRGGTDEGDHAW